MLPERQLWLQGKLRDGVAIIGVLALVVILNIRGTNQHVYGYDEADYRHAAEHSIVDHWLDTPSISFQDFLRLGFQGTKSQGNQLSLSQRIRASGDLPFLRHNHGPAYWYVIVPIVHLTNPSEATLRMTGILWVSMLAVSAYIACVWLEVGQTAGIVAATLVATSSVLTETYFVLSPHGIYGVVSTLALLIGARALQIRSRSLGLMCAAIVALSLLTVENAVWLGLALSISALVIARYQQSISWKQIFTFCWQAALVIIAVLILLWPASLMKLTLLRNYIFFAYMVLKRPLSYGTTSIAQTWMSRFQAAPFQWLFLASFAVYFLYRWYARLRLQTKPSKEALWPLPFFIYFLVISITIFRLHSDSSRFVAPLVVPLAIFTGAAFQEILQNQGKRLQFFVLLGLTLLFIADFRINQNRRERSHGAAGDIIDQVVAFLQTRNVHQELIVPQDYLPTLSWYLPKMTLRTYITDEDLLTKCTAKLPSAVLCQQKSAITLDKFLQNSKRIRSRYLSISNEPTMPAGLVLLLPQVDS